MARVSSAYSVAATGDYNGDGYIDILFRDARRWQHRDLVDERYERYAGLLHRQRGNKLDRAKPEL